MIFQLRKPWKTQPLLAISILLCFIFVINCLRTYWHQPAGDEVLYEFVWHESDTEPLSSDSHIFTHRISSLSDVIKSQIVHYKLYNGRAIIHTIEQCFTDHRILFCIINSIFFVSLILILARLICSSLCQVNFILFVTISLSLLYCFPLQSYLWISVNFSLGYLWPPVCVLFVFLLIQHAIKVDINKVYLPLYSILSFLAGWTHEACSIPMSGLFLYYIYKHRSRLPLQCYLLIISFWLGTLLIIIAPGTWLRITSMNGGKPIPISLRIADIYNDLSSLLWVWLVILLFLFNLIIKNRYGKVFYLKNKLLIILWSLAFGFMLCFNSDAYSYTFVELVSMTLVLKFLFNVGFFNPKVGKYILSILLLTLFIPHQIILVKDSITVYHHLQGYGKQFLEDPDGIIIIRDPDISETSRPFLHIWNTSTIGAFRTMAIYLNNKDKQKILINVNDIDALKNPSAFFTQAHKIQGSAPAFKSETGDYIWFKNDLITKKSKLIAHYRPLTWSDKGSLLHKVKYALLSYKYPSQEVLPIYEINCRYGRFYYAYIPSIRVIESIDLVT